MSAQQLPVGERPLGARLLVLLLTAFGVVLGSSPLATLAYHLWVLPWVAGLAAVPVAAWGVRKTAVRGSSPSIGEALLAAFAGAFPTALASGFALLAYACLWVIDWLVHVIDGYKGYRPEEVLGGAGHTLALGVFALLGLVVIPATARELARKLFPELPGEKGVFHAVLLESWRIQRAAAIALVPTLAFAGLSRVDLHCLLATGTSAVSDVLQWPALGCPWPSVGERKRTVYPGGSRAAPNC